jgi:NAD(P)-dependent dehydrogenase (short-subunit alcohol dehydrogenase family)
MDLGFKGKVALITGAGSQIGFGKGIALYMAKEGCDLALSDIDMEGLAKTAAEVRAMGRKVVAVQADNTKNDEVEAMVAKVIDEFGKIDILVNNAGAGTRLKNFIDMTREEWQKPININLFGTLNVTKAVVPYMIQRRYGRIVNITGGQGAATISMYGASKAGISSWMKSISSELLDYGIVVNGIHPGLGNTGLNASGRGGQALTPEQAAAASQGFGTKRFCTGEDVGAMVAFLASDVCSYMVGEIINMNAGAPPPNFP